jgi:predicted transcriptional regulator
MLVTLWELLIMHTISWWTMAKLYQSKAWLSKRYLIEKKTIEEIAKEAGTSHQTIYRYLVEYGLIRNQRSWSK